MQNAELMGDYMKRGFVLSLMLLICSIFSSSGAETNTGEIPALKDIWESSTVNQARADGCVVYDNGDIASGQEIWDEFLQKESAGEAATVRLAFYYTLSDPSHYDPDYYKQIKDMYPMLFIQELSFDGESMLSDGMKTERKYWVSMIIL